MYSAVYSVKTHDGSLTAIVIGSFFHFLGVKRMHTYENIKQDFKSVISSLHEMFDM